jgi:hypothetical protein
LLFSPPASAVTAEEQPAAPSPSGDIVLQSDFARLTLGADGRVRGFARRDGANLLAAGGSPLMLIRIGAQWHESNSLAATDRAGQKRLHVGFAGSKITAQAVVWPRAGYFEVETVALEGPGAEAVEQWIFVNLPVNITVNIGPWLNIAWNDCFAVAVIALEERTEASGAPTLRGTAHRGLGLAPRKAAIVACPTPRMLPLLHQIELQHRLPSPTLGGQWAKTSVAARKSWMITGLTAADEPAAFRADAVFDTARSLGVEYVVVCLGWWNDGLGHYALQKIHFPQGVASLKQVADRAHALGLKLGIHVMSASIDKSDAYVIPTPDRRLQKEGETTLAAGVDAAAATIPTAGLPASFGTARGYWAFGGTDVQIDDEIVSYRGLRKEAPSALLGCVRGAYGTRAAPHKGGVKAEHVAERYGWYVANPELAGEIGRHLADLINRAGLDMVCFDGADVPDVADPSLQFYFGHQVAAGILRHARRDVLLVSNGSTHFGWHLMARGGEDDALALGYQRWVDDYTVHQWGAYQAHNLFVPDFSWVGVFGHTPVLPAARPDDVEMVCARSLGFDGAVGWGFAACAGGPASVETFRDNGRRAEIAAVIRTYEKLRLENYFPAETRRPLRALGSHWRLLPPKTPADRYRLVPLRFAASEIIRPGIEETMAWQSDNDLGPQPLRVRIECLPALAPYGAKENLTLADFATAQFHVDDTPARTVFERTGETHPQAGTVARFACEGPAPAWHFPRKLLGDNHPCWAEAKTTFPKPLRLTGHRALGLWVRGDGGGEVLDVRLEFGEAAHLQYFQPITFAGWKYCELGQPEGDRVMDYFVGDKFGLHDLPLDNLVGMTLLVLVPPEGKNVSLRLGRVEALKEMGGTLVSPRLDVAGQTLEMPLTLHSEQYLETGDLWGSRDPNVCRVFDQNGNPLRLLKLASSLPTVPAGKVPLHLCPQGQPPARARTTLILGQAQK